MFPIFHVLDQCFKMEYFHHLSQSFFFSFLCQDYFYPEALNDILCEKINISQHSRIDNYVNMFPDK